MGHRVNLLTEETFKNSNYISFIEKYYGISNFEKQVPKQFSMLFNIDKAFRKLNNCFFSDSNLSILDKVGNATDILETLFKINDNENVIGIKYSVRNIKEICNKHYRQLYNQMSDWYYCFYNLPPKDISNNNQLKEILKSIEEEVSLIEYVKFDKNISYQKNTIKNYKSYAKYFSKFDNIYSKCDEFKEQYKNNFYENNGIKLDDNDLNKLNLLFKLLSCVNNGLVNIIADYKINEEFTAGKRHDKLYKVYLNSCNINYEKENFLDNSKDFITFLGIIKNKIDEDIKYDNTILIERFDLFFFYLTMEQCFYSHKIKVKSNYINKLLNDLIDIYKQFKEIIKVEKKLSLEELK